MEAFRRVAQGACCTAAFTVGEAMFLSIDGTYVLYIHTISLHIRSSIHLQTHSLTTQDFKHVALDETNKIQ